MTNMTTQITIAIVCGDERSTYVMLDGYAVDAPLLRTINDAAIYEDIAERIAAGSLHGTLFGTLRTHDEIEITYRVIAHRLMRRFDVIECDVQQPDGSFADEVLASGMVMLRSKNFDSESHIYWDDARIAAQLPQVVREDADLMTWWMIHYAHDDMPTGEGRYRFAWTPQTEAIPF